MPRSQKFPQLVTMRSFVMMKVVHIIKNRSKVIVITHIHENLLYWERWRSNYIFKVNHDQVTMYQMILVRHTNTKYIFSPENKKSLLLFIYLLLIIYWNNKSSSTKQNSPRTTMVNYIEEARFASVKGQWILGNREIKEKRS